MFDVDAIEKSGETHLNKLMEAVSKALDELAITNPSDNDKKHETCYRALFAYCSGVQKEDVMAMLANSLDSYKKLIRKNKLISQLINQLGVNLQ